MKDNLLCPDLNDLIDIEHILKKKEKWCNLTFLEGGIALFTLVGIGASGLSYEKVSSSSSSSSSRSLSSCEKKLTKQIYAWVRWHTCAAKCI